MLADHRSPWVKALSLISSFVYSQLILCTLQPLFLSRDLRCCLWVREVTVSPFAHLKRRNSRGLAVTLGSEEHGLEVGCRSVLGQKSALFHEQWNWWSLAFCSIPFPFCLCPQCCRHPTWLWFFATLACGSLRALRASTTERNSPVWCRLLRSSPCGTISHAAVRWNLPGNWSRLKLAPVFVSFIPEKPPQPALLAATKMLVLAWGRRQGVQLGAVMEFLLLMAYALQENDSIDVIPRPFHHPLAPTMSSAWNFWLTGFYQSEHTGAEYVFPSLVGM